MTDDTQPGTYRPGARVTTAAELDALPVDTVVVDCANIPRTKRRADSVMGAGWTHAGRSPLSSEMLADGHPLTVLFRPDAPQPATTDDTVERAAVEAADTWVGKSYAGRGARIAMRPGYIAGYTAALLAARGDAATPTVTAAQVERARLSEPMTYPPGQQVSRAAAHHLLAALGIEVTP